MTSWDLFICHASEDKKDIARPLAKRLLRRGLKVWYDELTLQLGDKLNKAIDDGLARSRFGIVILSPAFFLKKWPQRELDGLATKDLDQKVILPIWHNVTAKQIREYSLLLSDKLAISSSAGLDAIVQEIMKVIKTHLPQQHQTEFFECSYWQDKTVNENEVDHQRDISYSTVFGGELRIELRVNKPVNDSKLAPDPSIIMDHFFLDDVLISLQKVISKINAVKVNKIKYYNEQGEFEKQKGYPLIKKINIDVEASVNKERAFDGYLLEVTQRDHMCVFIPWEKGHSMNRPVFSVSEQETIKHLLIEFISKLTGQKVGNCKFFPTTNCPWPHGGFGYVMPYRLSDESELL